MDTIRLKATIHLARNHVVTEQDLRDMKPEIQRAIAAALPAHLAVDTVIVTSLREPALPGAAEDGSSGLQAGV